MPLADGGLMDVARKDEVGTGADESREHMISTCDRLLARPPGCSDQVMVEDDDLECAWLRLPQALLGADELAASNSARLMAPRAYRVEPDDVKRLGRVRRFGRLPLPLECAE